MAFDVYVGPLSRYISGDWKTIGQRIAEEHGLKFVRISPKQSLISRLFKPKPKNVYQRLREQIGSSFSSVGLSEPVWDDSPEQEYVTDRPGWEGFVAFFAQYAYALNPEMTPPTRALTMPELSEDQAFEAELDKGGSAIVAMMSATIFLPGTFDYSFTVEGSNGQPTGVAPLDLLDRALNTVCEHCGFDRTRLAQTGRDQVDEDATFEEAALYGTSIYAKLADEALKRNLPLIHDY